MGINSTNPLGSPGSQPSINDADAIRRSTEPQKAFKLGPKDKDNVGIPELQEFQNQLRVGVLMEKLRDGTISPEERIELRKLLP